MKVKKFIVPSATAFKISNEQKLNWPQSSDTTKVLPPIYIQRISLAFDQTTNYQTTGKVQKDSYLRESVWVYFLGENKHLIWYNYFRIY